MDFYHEAQNSLKINISCIIIRKERYLSFQNNKTTSHRIIIILINLFWSVPFHEANVGDNCAKVSF